MSERLSSSNSKYTCIWESPCSLSVFQCLSFRPSVTSYLHLSSSTPQQFSSIWNLFQFKCCLTRSTDFSIGLGSRLQFQFKAWNQEKCRDFSPRAAILSRFLKKSIVYILQTFELLWESMNFLDRFVLWTAKRTFTPVLWFRLCDLKQRQHKWSNASCKHAFHLIASPLCVFEVVVIW